MTKIPYHKPALSYPEQVGQLKSRGMIFADEAVAENWLKHLNYYRLAAYWLPFEKDHATHVFHPGTQFDDVLKLYDFDRALRLLLLSAIERIEVSTRAQWAYQMGHGHGAHAHLNPVLAKNQEKYRECIESLKEEAFRSEELFIKHLSEKYQEELPPIWAVCEVMSLGLLSRCYANTEPSTQEKISKAYGLDKKLMISWLHHLTVVRNICAHHSKIWNKNFTIAPMAPKSASLPIAGEFINSKKIYNTLIILLYFMAKISPQDQWGSSVKKLLINNKRWLQEMDFPQDWQNRSIWRP